MSYSSLEWVVITKKARKSYDANSPVFLKSSFGGIIFKGFVVSQMSCKNDHFILYDTCYRVLEMD